MAKAVSGEAMCDHIIKGAVQSLTQPSIRRHWGAAFLKNGGRVVLAGVGISARIL